MHSRRVFLTGAALLPLVACDAPTDDYADAVADNRLPLPPSPTMRDLVRLATLAPNGHNTQPWRFAIGSSTARILPDFRRRTPVVDPDDHHLFVSLGAAAENFVIGAAARGRPAGAAFVGDGAGRIDIDLSHGSSRRQSDDQLCQAIPARQSTRSEYDGSTVSTSDLKLLLDAGQMDGVSCRLLTAPAQKEAILGFVVQGNSAQIDDPTFVRELRDWVRFNPAQALASRDGLYSASSGSPTLPTWLGRRGFGLVFTKRSENQKYAAQLRSSAGIAVFVGDRADRASWVGVGRSLQRFLLQATVLGIRTAMINQPVEVPTVRRDFARWLGIGEARPDVVVRFGRAPLMPMSLRRPPAAVMA